MNLPNKLTVARLFMTLAFVIVMFLQSIDETLLRLVAGGLFTLTMLTDILDGHIARKHNLITDFGKFLDPLADKVMVMGAFFGLMVMERGNMPMFLFIAAAAFIVFVRELMVTGLRSMAAKKGEVVAADKAGKFKTTTQVMYILCALVFEPVVVGQWLAQLDTENVRIFGFIAEHQILSYIAVVLMVFMTLYSGLNYFKNARKYIDPME